jgi:uncharacterized membrane protein YcaP (DUF421 family)
LEDGLFDLGINGFEIIARTVIIYGALLIALRVAGKRELGQMTPFDLVVLLLISEAVQNALIDGDLSVTGGLIAAGTLIGVNYGVAKARDRLPWFREFVEGSPTVLVNNGKLIRENMRRENIEVEEVMMAIREHGLDNIEDVRLAVLETDGSISVVPADGDAQPQRRRRRKYLRPR